MTMTAASYAVEARDLVKTYPKGVRALDGLSLSVPPGQVFGLLGPNGESWILLTASPLMKRASCLVRRYVRDPTRWAVWLAWPRPRCWQWGRFATGSVLGAGIG
jgi:hypothetical protein